MYQIKRAQRSAGEVIRQNINGDLEYLTFPLLENTGIVEHLFSTRTGGVSEGIYGTMNLGYHRGDNPNNVLENYRRIGKILGTTPEQMVCAKQTHTTNIRIVTDEDKGKGVILHRDYDDIDGLITKEEGITLVTFYADCVPLFFVDPVNKVIGLAHSGWRGTVQKMGACMVQTFVQEFGSKPEDIIAAIGPSICQECYEVSEDVAQAFRDAFAGTEEIVTELGNAQYDKSPECRQIIVPGREAGKYQLDLWLANAVVLRQAGISLKNLAVTDICTCHNGAYLFSHRYSKGQRGSLAAFMKLKEH